MGGSTVVPPVYIPQVSTLYWPEPEESPETGGGGGGGARRRQKPPSLCTFCHSDNNTPHTQYLCVDSGPNPKPH